MKLFPSSLSQLILPAINHLLAQESWASQQLQIHAGKVACIDFKLASLRIKITAQGFLEPAPDETITNVTIRINPADIVLIMQDRERAISYVKLEGDADLAQTFSDLGKHLRWDAEHELSQIFGDIAGRRMANSGKAALHTAQNKAQKLGENVAEYLLEENPLLVRLERVTEFTQEVGLIRDDVERLLKRVEQCEQRKKAF